MDSFTAEELISYYTKATSLTSVLARFLTSGLFP